MGFSPRRAATRNAAPRADRRGSREKIAVVAPIPSASVSTTVAPKTGLFRGPAVLGRNRAARLPRTRSQIQVRPVRPMQALALIQRARRALRDLRDEIEPALVDDVAESRPVVRMHFAVAEDIALAQVRRIFRTEHFLHHDARE